MATNIGTGQEYSGRQGGHQTIYQLLNDDTIPVPPPYLYHQLHVKHNNFRVSYRPGSGTNLATEANKETSNLLTE